LVAEEYFDVGGFVLGFVHLLWLSTMAAVILFREERATIETLTVALEGNPNMVATWLAREI
jgi:hypothetical protein